jgi:hypothetical protein
MPTTRPNLNAAAVAEVDVHLALDPHDLGSVGGFYPEYGSSQSEVAERRFLSQTPPHIH